MKTTFYFFIASILLFNRISFFAQENRKPFVVSPLIGDTLSLQERNYYNLLPTINNFQWAVFYLNPDSLLDVRISYVKRNQVRDTLISNYKSLQNLRTPLFKRDIENSRRVIAYFENNARISGGFLSINNHSVLIYSDKCERGNLSPDCFEQINNSEIKKFIIPGESYIGESVVWWTLIGTVAGSAIGYVIEENTSSSSQFFSFKGLGAISGALIGSGVGLLTGLIYGSITSEPDIVIQPFSKDSIKGLSQYATFPYGEPDELKKIK